MNVYELTQHDDKYDLRYRIKDKIYLPSASPTRSASSRSPASLSSLSATPSTAAGAGESKEESAAHRQAESSQQSHHGRRDRRPSGVGTGTGNDADGADGSGGGEAGRIGEGPPVQKSFLIVTYGNVILCDGRLLQLYDFSGSKVGLLCVAPYSKITAFEWRGGRRLTR